MSALKYVPRQRCLSSSSSGSTASLLSILDQERYQSSPGPNLSDDNDIPSECDRLAELSLASKRQSSGNGRLNADQTYTNISSNNSKVNESLTPWQQWLLKKTQTARCIKKDSINHTTGNKAVRDKTNTNNNEQNEIIKEKIKQWTDRKNREEKLQKRLKRQKQVAEENLKRIEKQELQIKAERKFNEWIDKKHHDEIFNKRIEKINKLQAEHEKLEKQKQADKKYHEWILKLQSNQSKKSKIVEKSSPHQSGLMPLMRHGFCVVIGKQVLMTYVYAGAPVPLLMLMIYLGRFCGVVGSFIVGKNQVFCLFIYLKWNPYKILWSIVISAIYLVIHFAVIDEVVMNIVIIYMLIIKVVRINNLVRNVVAMVKVVIDNLFIGHIGTLRNYPNPSYINPNPWVHPALSPSSTKRLHSAIGKSKIRTIRQT